MYMFRLSKGSANPCMKIKISAKSILLKHYENGDKKFFFVTCPRVYQIQDLCRKKCKKGIFSNVQWWKKFLTHFSDSTYQECMMFARIGHGSCYYHWNEILQVCINLNFFPNIAITTRMYILFHTLSLTLKLQLKAGTNVHGVNCTKRNTSPKKLLSTSQKSKYIIKQIYWKRLIKYARSEVWRSILDQLSDYPWRLWGLNISIGLGYILDV